MKPHVFQMGTAVSQYWRELSIYISHQWLFLSVFDIGEGSVQAPLCICKLKNKNKITKQMYYKTVWLLLFSLCVSCVFVCIVCVYLRLHQERWGLQRSSIFWSTGWRTPLLHHWLPSWGPSPAWSGLLETQIHVFNMEHLDMQHRGHLMARSNWNTYGTYTTYVNILWHIQFFFKLWFCFHKYIEIVCATIYSL